jgi:diguanylate cyclase (GGDEF)-like protein
MRRPRNAERRWRLRTHLAAPVLLVALAVAASHLVVELSVRTQSEQLVAQRGAAVITGIEQQLTERERAKRIYAQLLADQDGVPASTSDGDVVGLAQALAPEKAKLDLERIAIYGPNGDELLRLGPASEATVTRPLVSAAMAGLTRSTTTVSDTGLLVLGASPIKGSTGIIGALVVGRTLGADELKQIHQRDGVELALFRGKALVTTTTEGPELMRVLAGWTPSVHETHDLDGALAPLHFQGVSKSLGGDGYLLALVPTADLDTAAQQRLLVVGGGLAALVLTLSGTLLLLARTIARPLESMVLATARIVLGDYAQRVAPSAIRELHDLAGAVNHLAEQVQLRVADLAHLAFHDVLTNLPNRARFLERLGRALERSQPGSLAVLFLDLDNFKFVNDSLGHEAGDRLLVQVASRLQGCVRPADTLARLGGDEFTILLQDIHGASEAAAVMERVLTQLQAPIHLGGQEVFVTTSAGIAVNDAETLQPEDLLRAADIAMYRAKTDGKARYTVFNTTMAAPAVERLELESDLRQAIARGELRLHYQPIVELSTGHVSEVEALVRWAHPRRGLVPPDAFIPLAEETGLILAIGRWVLEEACRQTQAWRQQFPGPAQLVTSVNVSARQLQQPDLVAVVTRALRDTGLHPGDLKLEITESIAMQDAESTIKTLRELANLGVQLAIDDFGTGYSSLAYLNRFPTNVIKIDRSFVSKLGADGENATVVRGIIALAQALGLDVTAEGIETAEQAEQLRALGCEFGQGYYFGKPQPPQALGELLTRSINARPDCQVAA